MTQGREKPLMKTRRLFFVVLALLPWLPALAGSKPPRPPLILPFAVHKAGTVVTTKMRVVEHRVYTFSLGLGLKKYDREDRKRVQKLAGSGGRDKYGKPLDYGLPIPVRLTISSIDSSNERVIYNKEVREEEMYGFTAEEFSKQIDRIELRPGLYRITIESLQDIPALANTHVTFAVGFRRK